ncbi:MAG: type IX secretion system membrane protein PorP/SprF [Crocinitomicaceae bacterium]
MKKFLVISAFILLVNVSKAQEQYVFNNFMMNDYYYNPAIAGSKDVHYANIGFRKQWVGFNEAPSTLYANFYGSAGNKMKHGYGASIVSDQSGLMQNTGFYLNYAYHIRLNNNWKLGFGIKPGYMQYNVKLYDAQLADAGDAILTGNVLTTSAFDLNSGLHLYSKKFFFMASMRNILGDVVKFTAFNDGLSRYYTGIIGYKWLVNAKKKPETDEEGNVIKRKKDFELAPTVMFNYVNPVRPQGSVMLKATYDKKYWLGLTYRSEDAVGVALGLTIKNRFNLGYAFDYSLGDIKAYNSGSHEIMLTFQVTSKKPSIEEQDEELNNSIFDDNKKKKKKEE